jgi:hypothetical protein
LCRQTLRPAPESLLCQFRLKCRGKLTSRKKLVFKAAVEVIKVKAAVEVESEVKFKVKAVVKAAIKRQCY